MRLPRSCQSASEVSMITGMEATLAQASRAPALRASVYCILVSALGEREARLAPVSADRRRRVAQPPCEEPRRQRDDARAASGERERDELLLVSAIGIERAVFA